MELLTAANQLTLVRLLLVPCLVALVVYGFSGWALIVFIFAGVTDVLDGLIARRAGQRTKLGAWLDPMADKLLLVSMFVVLTAPLDMANRLPIWLTLLVLSRDILIVLTAAVINLAIERRVFYPSTLGKVATLVYVVTCAVVLFFNYLERSSAFVDAAVYASLAITLASGIHYIVLAVRQI
ncbi:MAG: CDP-alcohol phosphatidyltransferase family protein [Acidobacteria bacterium]|nr:CDP-alcohol phosphatidyltransferase family protein [Acidobacteriota bacterium]